jgi:uncharacterized lipoprotein YddW (UPF0748 family)
MTPSRRTILTAGTVGLAGAASALGARPAVADGAGGAITPPAGGCPTQATTPKRDLRAIWIASVANIDWPSKTGLSPDAQRAELTGYLDLAQQQLHNAVILQVRPTADAFWPSDVEPWSHWLTGTQGKDPGWDPLGFAVDAAHERGLELHAWFNPFRVSQGTNRDALSPEHPGRQHPEWVVEYGGKLYYNPGLPEVRDLSVRAILDAVRKYDVDAVHFDDYFYPYPVAGKEFDDAEAYATHGNGLSLADWRRKNINDFMLALGRGIKKVRPTTQFGVSPFAIWRNSSTDPEGSDTQAGAETYDDLYADTRKWVREEWIDYIVPQIYWSRTFAVANYDKLARWWVDQVKGTRVHLYIGQANYKVGANADTAWNNPNELSSHLELNSQLPQIQGNMYFSAKVVRANPLDSTGIINRTWYTRPALTPASPWLDDRSGPPRALPKVHRRTANGRTTLSWNGARTDATSYVVYRVPGKRAKPCDLADARHIAAVVVRDGNRQTWVDPAPTNGPVTYVVSTVDRVRREGRGTVAR